MSSGLTSIETIIEINSIGRFCGNCEHERFGKCCNLSFDPVGKEVKPKDKACSEWVETFDYPMTGQIDLTGGEF